MIDFMLLAMPRSGTTWAAAWLNTDRSVCWHDPICHALPGEIDLWPTKKQYAGISCTGIWLWRDWVNAHPARKIILERDMDEVNQSLVEIGLNAMTAESVRIFESIRGDRLPYIALWNEPELIWKALLPDIPFDAERHAELAKMSIQPTDSPANTPTMTHLRRMADDFRRESCR